jgi:hypothetical protein
MNKQFILSSPRNGQYDVVMRIYHGIRSMMEICILSCTDYDQARSLCETLTEAQKGGAL